MAEAECCKKEEKHRNVMVSSGNEKALYQTFK